MTDDAAAIVYDEIQKTDVLTGAKYISFAEGVENGMIRFVGDDCKKALYDAIEARQVRPGLCKTAGLKLVYSPLNGSGLVPVTHVLNDMASPISPSCPSRSTPTATLPPAPTPTPRSSSTEAGSGTGHQDRCRPDAGYRPDADRVALP